MAEDSLVNLSLSPPLWDALGTLPALPAHDPGVPPAREGLLAVAVAAAGAHAQRRCAAVRTRFSYPLKLMLPAHLASLAPAARGADADVAAAAEVARPVWCYLCGYGGGLVAGDAVALSVRVGPAATAVLATQASTKVYHARSQRRADDTQELHRPPAVSSLAATVGPGGLLAVLPDTVIAFTDARFRQRQTVLLAQDASLVLLDWCSSGRRARGEAWAFASYESRTEVLVQGAAGAPQPLLIDAVRLAGSAASPLASRMGRCHVSGVLVLTGPRVAAHAAALLRDLEGFAPRCFARARAGAAATGGQGGGADGAAGAAAAPPFFFAAGSALEGPGGGCCVRLAAESADEAYAWARAALAPLHAQLGGAPYRL